MAIKVAFRRFVVGLDETPASAAAFEYGLEVACGLGSELESVYVEDETLVEAAALPFAREISLFSGQATPMNRTAMAQQLRARVLAAEARNLRECARRSLSARFRVMRGRAQALLPQLPEPGDVLVLGYERGNRWTPALNAVARAVLAAARSDILLVPSSARTRRGPVVAVLASGEEARTGAIARRIAESFQSAYEELVTEEKTEMDRLIGGIARLQPRLIVSAAKGAVAAPNVADALLRATGAALLLLQPEEPQG